jgi:hypothetical protein
MVHPVPDANFERLNNVFSPSHIRNPKVSNTRECNITRCSGGYVIVSHISRQFWWAAKVIVNSHHQKCFSMVLPAHSGLRPLIQFRNHFSQTIGLLWQVISSSQGRYRNTRKLKHRINTYTYRTCMPWVGFELTIPASERAKTVQVSDCDRPCH